MTEYTSFEISRRLAEAGFEAEPDAGVWGGESGCFHYQTALNDATDWSHMSRAYRSDALLTWLLAWGEKNQKHFLIWAPVAGSDHAEFLVVIGYDGNIETRDPTLSGALAEVVIEVLRRARR